MYYDIGAYDMLYSEFRQMYCEAWNEKFNHLCNHTTKNKIEGRNRILNENKNTYNESTPESEAFQFFKKRFQLKRDIS